MARNGFRIYDADTPVRPDAELLLTCMTASARSPNLMGERLETLAKEVISQPADIVERMKKVLGES